ncbi:hypothetical protein CVT25_002738 [Psilocybe cyanescens]|uniref:Uncharacterized protein n=1 Tax=Psilocybe cyanescens TaxID=93625 RepID=A0A409WL81_PSICY|nr:hypothetical protein CVT25_002738 [Psilocybe cyanescens]
MKNEGGERGSGDSENGRQGKGGKGGGQREGREAMSVNQNSHGAGTSAELETHTLLRLSVRAGLPVSARAATEWHGGSSSDLSTVGSSCPFKLTPLDRFR